MSTPGRGKAASRRRILLAAPCLALALCDCAGLSGLGRHQVAVTQPAVSPERAAAIAEIRAEAAAGDRMPFPDPFQAEQTQRLALRDEPLSVADVQTIEAELALIAEKRRTTTSARELAALDARAKELKRLAMLKAQP